MDALSKELILLVHQFLCEEKYKKTVHMLEKESGVYFNMRYLEEVVKNGEWDEVDTYLSGFTRVDENRYSMKMFFDIRKQKYLEALDKNQYGNALEVLKKDLKVFAPLNEDLFKEITMLLALDNFRENTLLSKYEDTKSARAILFEETKKLIQANPIFKDKLQLPSLKNSRLRTLINQSLNWQHQICPNPKSNPDIRTLFVDHFCMQQPNGPLAPSAVTNQFMCPMPNASCSLPLAAHGPLLSAGPITSLGGWMANTPSIPHPAICCGPIGSSAPNNADSEHVLKRARSFGISEEVNNKPINLLPDAHPGRNHFHASYFSDDIPRIVVANLTQSSAVKSMDFHPVQEMMLLVGTSIGDFALWDVGRKSRLAFKNFKVWDLEACSMTLKASLANEHSVSVNRVSWSPDGTLFGVAYSKNIVQLYLFNGTDDLQNHVEIDAHDGNVSDLAFSSLNEELYIITGGDDKLVKVWSVATGSKQYTFEGHEAPVYSVSPHHRDDIQFVFSTSVDGKIRAWLYDDLGPRVNYDAPGQSCTRMIYSADGKRLFSCGTSKEGESHIVEWDENEGAVKRSYIGLGKRSIGVVQLDTKNRVLVAGDEFAIKFWDIDNVNLLTTADADGGLPASPCIKFSKQGIFLAVSTSENGVKILGNAEGVRMVHSIDNLALDASRIISESVVKSAIAAGVAENGTSMIPLIPHTGDTRAFMDMNPRVTTDMEISRSWKLTEINEQAQLRSLRLPDSLLSVRVIRLSYTHSGGGIVALAYNAVHKLWRWQRDERNLAGKATTNIPPRLWQPSNGVLMTNDISETNLEYAVPCFAISKNDSYVASANGGRISLFNLLTFRTMTTFMSPRPAATSIAFHPEDNNIIVVGMEDASIQIYFVRVDEVQFTLRGHLKRVTGLAFSTSLNIIVSSGADAKLCVWNMERWEDAGSTSVHIPSGRAPTYRAQTRVQFHKDQTHLLVVHETHIAIYEAPKLDLIKQWVPRESAGRVTDATYSCDSEMIYVCVEDGSICVLVGTLLRMRCRISPTAYLHSNPSLRLYPLVITAHPTKPDQFALGLTDGGVQVVEPLEAEGKWGTEPPQENGVGPSRLISATTPRHI